MSSRVVSVAVVGASGCEAVRGVVGVGKSLLCNRFVAAAFDQFFTEHCSVLSQTDFAGSPVINSEHWLYWGERILTTEENSNVVIRLIEQTEFLDDETYEPIAGPSKEEYCKRAAKINLSSRDKLMYIRKEQLGLEADFPQHALPDGKFSVDAFIVVCDVSKAFMQNHETKMKFLSSLLSNVVKTKKPAIIALTKSDRVDEEARRAVMTLLARKEFKAIFYPPIEVSSIFNVNVDEIFHLACHLVLKNKLKRKPLPYSEAAFLVDESRQRIKSVYLNLLSSVIPVKSWPAQRFTWNRLLADLDRHPDFIAFVKIFGQREAYNLYEQHVCEAKEHWMSSKLRSFIPQLPQIFATLLERPDFEDLDWSLAKEKIVSHALFDDFFQPIGSLGRQLDPMTPDGDYYSRGDPRVPAEILMREEARYTFESFKKEAETARRKEKLEEDFENLLAESKHITPGKPLKEVHLFLQGFPAFDLLSPNQAATVYDRYQNDLMKRAECEFIECLLEYVELFTDSLKRMHYENLTPAQLNVIKDVLEADLRYRWLSRVFELREKLILDMYSFWRQPSPPKCFNGSRCADFVVPDALEKFFHRRNDNSYVHLVDVTVHGDTSIVAQFITEINCFLHSDPFQSGCGSSLIRCFGEIEGDDRDSSRTNVYLIDSLDSLHTFREKEKVRNGYIPSLFVVVCDPSNYDLIPVLQQHGAKLAAECDGSFFGVGSTSGDDTTCPSFSSDCSSLIGRERVMGICDAICSSQLTRRRSDLRIQVSLMCGDPYSLDALSWDFFGGVEQLATFRPIVHPNLINVGLVPVDIFRAEAENEATSRTRVDFTFGSYHSWMTAAPTISSATGQLRPPVYHHGHIFVYSTRRVASFAHARAAISRVLDDGWTSVSGKSILLVALLDHPDHVSYESNVLLTEGSELSTSIGARFIAVASNELLTPDVVEFVFALQSMAMPNSSTTVSDKYHYRNSQSTDFFPVVEHVRPTTLHLKTPTSINRTDPPRRAAAAVAASAAAKNNNKTTSNGEATSSAKADVNSTRSNKFRKEMVSRPALMPSLPMNIRKSESFQTAPLATPEMVEIAPEYSLVKDALSCDEHIYETLDHAVLKKKTTPSSTASSTGSRGKTSKNSLTSETLSQRDNPPNSESCRAGRAVSRRARTALPALMEPIQLHRTTNLTPTLLVNSSSPPTAIRPEIMSRSVTVAVINPLITSPRRLKKADIGPPTATLRQSFSAESLSQAAVGEKKAKRRDFSGNRFVRKVATSFRFKKDKLEEKRDEGRKSEEAAERRDVVEEPIGSRSLPQSPQVDRKQAKKYASLNATERVTNALSWLPSRSPKRSNKSATTEIASSVSSSSTTSVSAQGVVLPEDTLDSLCAAASGGVPDFVSQCISIIEETGGLESEGLYRVPGNQAHVLDVERIYRDTGVVDLSSADVPVHVGATALKNFFSCLPLPLIPTEIHSSIISCVSGEPNLDQLKMALNGLPSCNRDVLQFLIKHLQKVSQSPVTAMDMTNLSKVWFPTLFRPAFNSYEALSAGTHLYQKAMEVIFENADSLL